MKTGFIIVLYKTAKSEVDRLRNEIKDLKFNNYQIYFIDNSINNTGYAGGVNEGIRQALKDNCQLFVIANPDISFEKLSFATITFPGKKFDIWGYAMKQEGKMYYGGEIDRWRMSGGLVTNKPKVRLTKVDFVSGSLMVIKKEVLEKVGLLDENYFLYYEEVDYCYKAAKLGFKIGIDSLISYDHFETSKDSPTKNYYLFKNRIKFLFKYGNFYQKVREVLRAPKTIYEEIIKRPFYLNFFSLNLSSLVNKILHFFLFLLLINYFKPEQYAIYTLAWTHIGLFSPLLDFGTTSYGLINLKNNDIKESSKLFSFRIILSIIAFLITITFVFVFGYQKQYVLPIILTSFVIFSNMLSGTFLIFVSVIHKSYLSSIVSMIFQLILVISLIIAILVKKDLIIIFWLIFILYNFYSLINYLLIKKQLTLIKFDFDISSWLKIAKKSSVYLALSLLAGFYSKLDVILINFLKGPRDVGIYSAGYRFLDALMFIIVAYNVSSMPLFSSMVRENKKSLFLMKIKKDFILLILIGGIIALGIYLFSPLILPIFMKNEYRESLSVLRVIIFALPLILLTSIALNGIYALHRARNAIYLFAFMLVFNFTLNYLLIPNYSYMASSWITVTGELLNVIISFIILRKAYYENFR